MSSKHLAVICLLSFIAPAFAAPHAHGRPAKAEAGMKAFTSDAALKDWLKRLKPRGGFAYTGGVGEAGSNLETVAVTGARTTPSITNTQETGVDEGDIVKLHGDTLVVLRRGRLFTISLKGGAMTAVDAINAYPPGVDASSDWYDEMLIAGDRVIVIGYSYGRGGTEINRFDIGKAGHLRFRDAHHLRSNDYYSSRNYASRLVGHHLILYTPLYLPWNAPDPMVALPALRRWTGDAKAGFERISTARQVYSAAGMPDDEIDTVHTIVNCDVAAPEMSCKATSVLGPGGRVFYVSETALYVWITPWWNDAKPHKGPTSWLFRLPLDGGRPSSVGMHGVPIDQFSFREEKSRDLLTVLVSADARGDAMWDAERRIGSAALAYVNFENMGDGSKELALSHYRALPLPSSLTRRLDDYAFHNRFVGKYLLYGFGNNWGRPEKINTELMAVAVHGAGMANFTLPHGIDRIEAMGGNAVVVGSDATSLYFSAVELTGGPRAVLGDRYVLASAAQAETRSHGFFFRPDKRAPNDGVLGLPVAREANPAYRQLVDDAAAVLFLRRENGKFVSLGEVPSHPELAGNDACVASCYDWYGNARPIFIGERTFALMGYELVEVTLGKKALTAGATTVFAPPPAKTARTVP